MSTKFGLFLAAAAVSVFALLHRAPPELANSPEKVPFVKSIPARAQYGLGTAGTFMVGGIVRKMHAGTDQELKELTPELKKKGGRDGTTARDAARIARQLDATSLDALEKARPILAMNSAMKARNFVEVARGNLLE